MATRWCQVAVAAILLAAPVSSDQSDDPKAAVISLLAYYDAGKYQDVEQLLARQPKGPLAGALLREGDRWIKGGSGETIDRRRFVAGAVALEIVGAGLTDEWFLVFQAIEWGCRQVMATPPGSGAELQWQLGSISLLQAGAGMLPTGDFAENHILQHAMKRAPGSSRVRLAAVIDSERSMPMLPPLRPGQPVLPTEIVRRYQGRAADVVKQYVELTSAPDVAEEARLRVSAFQYRYGSPDDAIPGFVPLMASRDPYIGYVASFLTGEALRRSGRSSEALAAYRQALTFAPKATSASLGLSAALVATGDVEGAIAAAGVAATTQAPLDPWRVFAFGTGRLWPQWREALRRELRR